MTDESFSSRHGHVQPKPIVHREDLPEWARKVIFGILAKYTTNGVLSEILTSILKPFQEYETNLIWMMENQTDVEATFLRMEWFHVYDVIEAVHSALEYHDENHVDPVYDWNQNPTGEFTEEFRAEPFRLEINRYFVYAGIGWELTDESKVVARGDKNFTQAIEAATAELIETKRPSAAEYLQNAQQALSQRPKPNTGGAVSQATNAIEALLHNITGEAMTLGKYLDRYPTLFHSALKQAIDKLYGYASDVARHGKEGGPQPTPAEARYILTVCAATCTLLAGSNPPKP
jgi:AbiJ N-terminal domain 4